MNAETAAAWAGWVAAAVATGSTLIAVRANRHSKESAAAANASVTEARRSADAAEASSVEARRSADAAERQAAAAEAMIPPPTPKVKWDPSKLGEYLYALRNVGTDAAENVKVEARGYEEEGAIRIDPDPGLVPSGATIEVFFAGGAESPDVYECRLAWDGQVEPVLVALPRW